MKLEDYLWVHTHLNKFQNNVSWQQDEIRILFDIYTNVSGKLQRPTGCSRCVASARSAVYMAYLKEKQKLES